jgi:hypothetical protein
VVNADVTIPADVAKHLAAVLRSPEPFPLGMEEQLADLLDPRPVSLRDECITVMQRRFRVYDLNAAETEAVVDALLAVVKARIETLPQTSVVRRGFIGDVVTRERGLLLDDVLALFRDDQ